MELEVISRETIKPSSPTPPHLKTYPLSYIDHIVFRNYVPFISFYSKNSNQTYDQTSQILKTSLSQVLTLYYPLAGRYKDQVSIDCNDKGVTLIITRIKQRLYDEFLKKIPNHEALNPLFPDELQWKEIHPSGTILAVQINYFDCGGIAIGACMSHKVGDASTLINFVNDWASITAKSKVTVPPSLNGGSVCPLGELPNYPEVVFPKVDNTPVVVSKRFVFEDSKIKLLKAMVSNEHGVKDYPTRVQVVSALLYKAAVSCWSNPKTTIIPWLRFAADLRPRTDPPMPAKTVGNMVWFVFVPCTAAEARVHETVSKTQEAMREFREEQAKKFGRNDMSFVTECLKSATSTTAQIGEEEMVMLYVASWCRYGTYEGDFGWGKPMWVTTSECPVKNSVILIDTRDGDGIEAIVSLEEQDMALFECDVELLQYASLNPTLIV